MSAHVSFPFRVDTSRLEGHAYIDAALHGVARFDGRAIMLEFREQQILYGGDGVNERAGDVNEVTVPLGAVARVEIVNRWFRKPCVVIHVSSIQVLQGAPGVRGLACHLPLARPDRGAAEAFVRAVADEQIRRM